MSFLTKYHAIAVSAALMLTTAAFSAHAALERVGPPNSAPSMGGFPAWYQDRTGLALEFCAPQNQSEMAGGWCLLLPGDVPVVPETFPTNFFDEHFYFAASAGPLTLASNGGKASLVLAVESAFASGPPIPGDQITFSRIRISLNPAPMTGTYKFIHPYGEELIDAVAGERIFFTEDIGINCAPGTFDCALNSRLGPFLLPSAVPGGTEHPALTATNPTPDTNPAHFGGAFAPTPYPGTGKSYIADPARIGPVTGGLKTQFTDSKGNLRNHNIFRIEGPAGSNLSVDPTTGAFVDFIETTNLSLMGRAFAGAMPGTVKIDGAYYTQTPPSGLDPGTKKLDVFATAFLTTFGRIQGQAQASDVAPQLTFFDAACAGTIDASGTVHPPFSAPTGATETQMFADREMQWGQINNLTVIPPAVCIKNSSARDVNGNVVPSFNPQIVTDMVTIGQALYDRSTATLAVTARSSDVVDLPTLTLSYGSFRGDLVNGIINVPNVVTPPSKVRVFSNALGMGEYQVSTNVVGSLADTTTPTALNDSWTFDEDSGQHNLAVLANDSAVANGTVTVTSAPQLGSAVVDAVSGSVTYTSNLNASGTDAFAYQVTVGTQVSNSANVTLTITPVNDAPVAVNNNFSAIANQLVQLNVLANDTDPDGAADLAAAVLVTPPAAGATVTGGAGGVFAFNATAGGTYSFTYQARDASLATSANTATVTVQVAATETLNITRAEYIRSKGRLKAQGTISPAANQTITIVFVDAAGTVLGAAGSTVAVAGSWLLDQVVPMPTGTTAVRATSSNGTVRSQALTLK